MMLTKHTTAELLKWCGEHEVLSLHGPCPFCFQDWKTVFVKFACFAYDNQHVKDKPTVIDAQTHEIMNKVMNDVATLQENYLEGFQRDAHDDYNPNQAEPEEGSADWYHKKFGVPRGADDIHDPRTWD